MSVRLGPYTLSALPADVRRPGYDRARLKRGILHIGVGAFHRCHQGEFTDDALEAAFGDWGIVGVNLRAPDLDETLGAQGGLYCRELRDHNTVERRLIGALIETISVGDAASLERALALAADPAIRVVTLTITEKGYCHVPATGLLDTGHPDIAHDLAHPRAPRSVPGFILEMLRRRFAAGAEAPTIISCDNVPDNGATLRRCVTGLAEAGRDPLAGRIAETVNFLNTMVDRIVPATAEADIERFAAETGILDLGLVIGEPFRHWMIEGAQGRDLPAWDRVGALYVPDVAPYEILKMRVVNGIQTGLCQLGLLSGIDYMADVMADPVFARFAREMIEAEVLPHLPAVPGIDVPAYLETTLSRLTNPALRHRTAQISTDGSQKIRQRLLEPLRAALAADTPCDRLLWGIAGWMVYAGGRDHAGRTFPVNDPLAGRTLALSAETGEDAGAYVRGLLSLETVFGTDLGTRPEIVAALTDRVARLRQRPARAIMADIIGGGA
ncbi:mannitol dehydrogenase family protein [Arsenicitalea aurantiaca]|uniref:Mannitol dehydrogenase family protein n=1 Tax=Arsenicitalea aurantiaca TaxID=1783274 RepID=A0A433XLI6_9HYPH|nr:mannitol dehydrogenase family protein [Arsenicitalea aurantiaca]RUT34858.1 mannitol dehydrogenase family protein [Arsenicitalea aurantiaca]